MASALRALPFLLLLLAAVPAAAEERILHYLSDVQVNRDSSLAVTETIRVHAENNEIRHGIYRDFPTRYRGRHGSQVRVGFTFEGATLNGQPVPATTEAFGNGVRIKIGDPETFVSVGEHDYVIRYRTTRQIGRFRDYDELYWNATGNGWAFPIDVAEARIRLPQPVRFGQRAVYTGAEGSTAANAAVAEERSGEILFRTTGRLQAYEGLTVAAAFPKGVIAEPTSESRMLDTVSDYGPPAVGVLGLLGLCLFYYVAWQRAGRNPRAGTVVPLFSPPDDLTPAAMRYVMKMRADNRAFAAGLVDMGVRGHVRLVEEDGGWLSSDKTRIERLAGKDPLPSEEEAALKHFGEPGEAILLEKANHKIFSAAKKDFFDVLKKQYEGKLFRRNWGWAFAGLALFVAVMWLAAAAVVAATGLGVNRVLVPLGAIAVTGLLFLWIQSANAVGQCLMAGVAFGFAALALGTGLPILAEALATGWWLPMMAPLLAFPLMVTAFWWIAAPTREGRKVLDRIAGFKQYLSITERERLDRMHPPKDTPALFERYLPFAIALRVENRWAERFAGVLAAAAAQGQQGFGWYSGSHNAWDDPGGFADNVGSALASSISSASTAPGSSSGSGGGGSSGGGGGGGGGGGW